MIAANFTKGFAAKAIEYSLKRMSVLEEFISNIHLSKLTQWDRHFQDRIEGICLKNINLNIYYIIN